MSSMKKRVPFKDIYGDFLCPLSHLEDSCRDKVLHPKVLQHASPKDKQEIWYINYNTIITGEKLNICTPR